MTDPDEVLAPPIVVMLGRLGWGNRKSGVEAYGPGDRWGGNEYGDLLGDALEREGCHEGTHLVVAAFPNRFTKSDAEALVAELQKRFGHERSSDQLGVDLGAVLVDDPPRPLH